MKPRHRPIEPKLDLVLILQDDLFDLIAVHEHAPFDGAQVERTLVLHPLDARVVGLHPGVVDERFATRRTADRDDRQVVGDRATAVRPGKVEQLRPHVRTIVGVPRGVIAKILVEVAIDSVAGARAASAAGAGRLELCSALLEGGLTPSLGMLQAVQAAVPIPVFAMLRPRGGDFLYDDEEFAVMRRDAEALRQAGAAGLVTGILSPDGQLDEARFAQLRAIAGPLPITCHRAFDLCADADAALETLVRLGIPRVLSSGQAASAPAGTERLRQLVARAGDRIVVMPGAGVRDDNVAALVQGTGCREVHLSATSWRRSAMQFRRPGVPMGTATPPDEYSLRTTDGDMIARVVEAANRVTMTPP